MTTRSARPESSERSEGPSALPGDAERWAALEALLHETLAREPAERPAFLAASCADGGMRADVEALVAAHEAPGKLDALADAVMRPLLAPPPVQPPSRRAVSPSDAPALPELDRYRVIDRLGGGGMGIVYRARDERLDRDVALKFLSPHLSSDAAAKKRFMVEARAAASLEHPNICTVHEIGETGDGQLYIVMGCYDGETVATRVARGPLAVRDALEIASDVARGLAKAHARGIVHRDIKPANIMITADGVVKILDFGIAKLSDINVTQTVGVIGTLAYMSPEQAFGDAVDARADVWALGVVLHEMLIGGRPFGGPGEQAMLYSILTQELEPLAATRSDVPDAVDTLLRRALAKNPTDRFADAQEMLVALQGVTRASVAAEHSANPVVSRSPTPIDNGTLATPTDSVLSRAGERRHATVVVTGISGYDQLVEHLASREVDALTAAVRDAAAEIAIRHGGIVNHFAAEEAILLFGVTAAHEDDYLRAVRAALELHERVRTIADDTGAKLRLRTGVHTGALVAQRQRAGDRRFRLTGAPLEVATRLAALAGADAILVSPECHRLIAPFVDAEAGPSMAILPNAPPVTPYRIVGESSVQTRLEVAERSGLTPYAGRLRELAMLEEQLGTAVRGEGGLAVVIGDPGSGKSRLLHELRHCVEQTDARLVLGRCDAYGRTTPYMPFVQALRDLLGVHDDGRDTEDQIIARVRAITPDLEDSLPLYLALVAIDSAAHPLPKHLHGEHLQAAMLEALTAVFTLHARGRPTVLLLEDWHWADEASRAALEQLAEVAPAHALLIVVTCRPDPSLEWSSGDDRAIVHLGPLGTDAAHEIMCAVLGAEQLAPALAQHLYERTAGNPFFLEETCQALQETGAITVRDGSATADEDATLLHLPETVQAVIGTRLDRLPVPVRDTLRIASVIGREFARGVLEELTEGDASVGTNIDALRHAGLVLQISVTPEPVYRFKHVLTQEVAYDSLLEHQRRTLHAAAGRAIERRYANRLEEHRERLSHHYARAEEWAAAVQHGIAAADRSKALSQFADAIGMLDRTREWLDQLPADESQRALLGGVLLRQERLAETLGQRARQIALVEELIALLAPHGGSPALAEAYLRQGDVFTLLRRFDAADRALGTSLRLSRELGDRAGERNAVRSIGLLRSHEGRYEDATVAIQNALELDVELGETRAAAGDVASLGNILRRMGRPRDALEALEQGLEYLTREDDPIKWCAVMTVISTAYRDLGDDTRALQYLERVRSTALERRLPVIMSFCLPAIAHIQLHAGDVEQALATYRQGVDLSRRARHADGLAQVVRALGEVLFGLGRYDEALPLLHEAADVFAQLEDRDTETLLWQRIATAYERQGEPFAAELQWEAVRVRCEGAGDHGGESIAIEGLARCARERGARSTAIAHYERALARTVSVGALEREVTLRNTLGLMRWEDGEYVEALRQYEAALRLCRELEDRIHEGLILNSLGATLLKLRRYDEACTALEEAAAVNAHARQGRLEAHSHAVLGDAFLERARPADACRAYKRSLTLRSALADRLGEGWMLQRLSRALSADRRPDDALMAFSAASAIAVETGDAALHAALHPAPTDGPLPPNPQR